MKSLLQKLLPKSRTIQEPKKINTGISLIDFLGSFDVNAKEVYLLLLREYDPLVGNIYIPQHLVNEFIPSRFYKGVNQLIHLNLVRRSTQSIYLLNPFIYVNPDNKIQNELIDRWTLIKNKELINE